MKKCEETNFSTFASWHTGGYPYHQPGCKIRPSGKTKSLWKCYWRKQDPGSSFPRSFLNYETPPSTTQGMALPARSEQYALFLTPIRWTNRQKIILTTQAHKYTETLHHISVHIWLYRQKAEVLSFPTVVLDWKSDNNNGNCVNVIRPNSIALLQTIGGALIRVAPLIGRIRY